MLGDMRTLPPVTTSSQSHLDARSLLKRNSHTKNIYAKTTKELNSHTNIRYGN